MIYHVKYWLKNCWHMEKWKLGAYEKQVILAKMVLKEVILSQDDGTVQTEIPSVCSQIHWKIKKALVGVVVVVQWLSRVRVFATPWIVVPQAPLSMGFSRQEDWSGLPFLSQKKKKKHWIGKSVPPGFHTMLPKDSKELFCQPNTSEKQVLNFILFCFVLFCFVLFSLKGASPVAQQ